MIMICVGVCVVLVGFWLLMVFGVLVGWLGGLGLPFEVCCMCC